MYKISTKEEKLLQKVQDTLKIGGRSETTIGNYACAIKRFFNYFPEDKDISKFNEDDILDYIKHDYIDKGCASNTYNMNICAIKYLYSICFNKQFNNNLLPRVKLIKKIPTTITKELFLKLFNEENNLKHKCWLILAFCSGLRVSEVSSIKIEDIYAKEHKLRVLGKRKKERLTILPDITIKFLRLYYKASKMTKTKGYLFEGNSNKECMNSKSIINYFSSLKETYNLEKNISFHSLRHSFSTNFMKSGGDIFVLKSMLGHSSLNSTGIYVHIGRDFSNLNGVKYD